MAILSLEINKDYKVTTVDAVNLGLEHNNLKFKKMVGLEDALKIADVYSLNNDVATQAEGITKDLSNLSFYVFEDMNKDVKIFASTWISDATLISNGVVANITIENLTNGDLDTLRRYLLSGGYKFEINIT